MIMISKTIGCRGTLFSDKPICWHQQFGCESMAKNGAGWELESLTVWQKKNGNHQTLHTRDLDLSTGVQQNVRK